MIAVICNDVSLVSILSIVKRVLLFIQIIVPIILLFFTTISLIKLIKNPEEKNGVKKITNQFIATIIIFFIPTMINVVMNLVGETTNFSSCWQQANNTISISNQYYGLGGDEKKPILPDSKKYESGIIQNSCMKKGKKNKVLFYGNSKTVGPNGGETIKDNNVAAKFEGIAKSKGYDVEVTTIDEGLGYQSSRLNAYYDCYVDQQCTACMPNASGVASALGSRANTLKHNNPNITIYLRQIWTYCSGGQINNDGGLNQAFQGAEEGANQVGATIIPDGKAMLENKNKNTGIRVCDDDRHQNNRGAYLIGATIFKSLTGETPIGASYYGDVDANSAKTLQKIASTVDASH